LIIVPIVYPDKFYGPAGAEKHCK